ncbi:hypothetical protein Q2T40_19595 [Winogradskyella maritima]|uniref:PH (Pleckstrin Homology) domain-containing protein n=1 Tax=Winogradskyella maritima TaxID=1517766 RepID=A0ABV8AHF2_9FLAO|nr:hypothetical protein [Winogradskyella maritima]
MTFLFIRPVPIMRRVFGILLFGLALFIIINDIKGLILCGIATYFILTEGTEFNFETNKYRLVKSFLGLNFGAWKAIPDIEYVSVFKTTEKTAVRSRSAETTVSNSVYRLNLFYNTNQKIRAYTTSDKDDAFEKAELFSKYLNTEIYDATEE